MNTWTTPNLIFCKVVFILLQLFSISFEIFDHKILSSELIMIREMIDNLMIGKSDSYFDDILPDLGLKIFLTVHTVAQ